MGKIASESKQKLIKDLDSVITGTEELIKFVSIEMGPEALGVRIGAEPLGIKIGAEPLGIKIEKNLKQSKKYLEYLREFEVTGVLVPGITGTPNIGEVAEVRPPNIGDAGSVPRAQARGEARLVEWTRDGTLIDSAALADFWGIKRQTLDAARRRGEVFSLWIKGQHWYPSELQKLERTAFARINASLGDLNPSSKIMFLLHKHGALKGRTPADAAVDMLEEVVRLAASWNRD